MVDMLHEWNNDPSFWTDVTYTNLRLNTESDKADEIVADFLRKHFNTDRLEAPVRAVMVAENDDTELTLDTAVGKLLPFHYEEYSETPDSLGRSMSRRALTLCIMDDNAIYKMPLSANYLVAVDMFNPQQETASTPFGHLKQLTSNLKSLVTKESFLASSSEAQQLLIDGAIYDINSYIDIVFNDGDSTVTLTNNNDKPIKIDIKYLQAIWDGELYFVLTSTKQDLTYTYKEECVIDIAIDDVEDVLEIFDNPRMQAAIRGIEDFVNDADNEDELTERILISEEELANLTPEDFFYSSTFSGTGFVFKAEGESGSVSSGKFTDFEQLDAGSLTLQCLDSKWRVMMELVSDDGAISYIIPNSNNLVRFDRRALTIDECLTADLIANLQDTGDETQHIIKSGTFRRADLNKQRYMLEKALTDAREQVDHIFNALHDSHQASCLATSGWAIDSTLFDSDSYTPEEIAELELMAITDQDPLEITCDSIQLVIPELAYRDKKAKSLRDFPLSHGRPMLLIENVSLNLTYLIPVDSVLGLMPMTIIDEDSL